MSRSNTVSFLPIFIIGDPLRLNLSLITYWVLPLEASNQQAKSKLVTLVSTVFYTGAADHYNLYSAKLGLVHYDVV